MALHNTQVNADQSANNGAQLFSTLQGKQIKQIKFANNDIKNVGDSATADSTSNINQDHDYNLDGASISYTGNDQNFQNIASGHIADAGSSLSSAIPNRETPSSNGGYNFYNQSSNNSNNSNFGYTTPQINDGSQTVKFPSAPTNITKHSNKVSTKQLKNDKASVKKDKKHLKNIKRELKETKSKSRKAKLNKQLKQAKKAFAKSEVQLNHTKHAAK